MGTLWPKHWKKNRLFTCNWGFLYIESCIMLWLKAPFQTFISFSYTDKFGVICEDVMTKKHENLMIFQCFQQSDSPYLFYVTCLWNHKLVNVCWPSRSRWRSNRNLLTVACNCSILVIIILSFRITPLTSEISETAQHWVSKLHSYIDPYPTTCRALFGVDPDYHSGSRAKSVFSDFPQYLRN